MRIDPSEVQWDDGPAVQAPAPPRARATDQVFYNPEKVPASLDIAGLYGNFQQTFPGARVTSTRRTQQENASLPNSAPQSFHLTGEAWDAVPSSPDEERALVAWGTQNGLQVEVEREPYHVHFEPPARGITTSALGGEGGSGGPAPAAIDPAAVAWDDAPPTESGPGYRRNAEGVMEIDIVGGANDPQPSAVAPKPAAKDSLFRMDSDFADRSGVNFLERTWASAKDMFAGHEAAAKYLAEQAGGTVDKDADGEPVVVLPDGTRYRVNDKGFDPVDAANIAGNAAAFYTPASAVANLARSRQVGTVGRMALQGTAAAATDAALQGGVNGGDIDGGRVALAGAGGAGGEAVGTALGAAGRYAGNAYASLRGAASPEAVQLARAAGVDNPTRQQLNQFAQAARELQAGANPNAITGQNAFGLKYTLGERMGAKIPERVRRSQLSREELLRQSPDGSALRELGTANRETVDKTLGSMSESLGGRAGATPAELAQGAASRLRGQADELDAQVSSAYEEAGKAGRTAISTDAVAALPQRLRAAVSDMGLDPDITPAAFRTLEQMSAAAKGLEGSVPGARTAAVTMKALEKQRRILNNRIGAATNSTDRRALTLMKREFDGWMDESIDSGLVSGDPAALEMMKRARGLRAEYGRRFEGKADTDKFIGGLLDGTRTPEELVNIALGASQVSKAGGARFVQRLKDAAGNDPEVIGQLRAAHFLRMTQNTRGETVDFGKLISNIKATENSNGSIVRALYSPQEWAEIRRLADALDPLVAKGDFAKSSGTAERLMRGLYERTVGGVPMGKDLLMAPARIVDFLRVRGAVNSPVKLRRPAPAFAAPVGSAWTEEATN